MPLASWPGSLPQTPLRSGFSQNEGDGVVRSEMDTGPAKVRRRFTAVFIPVSCAMNLTTAQVAILKTFFMTTLNGGADEFEWVDHISGAAANYRFTAPPGYQPAGGDFYRTTLSLEIVPS